MKTALPVLCTLLLGACTSTASVGYSPYLEPIPGSITYGGQPRTKLTKAPIGSTFSHQFRDPFGRQVHETYMIAPDRSLLLVRRRYRDLFGFDDD
ncbi:hypothetical protein J2Z31_003657 [Sinorhizobium kostiense]|uniref:Transmembrane protein n=1 Tax=Sinorhizobium kostiense TaxID=76747 RepID=A0ABS4R2K9_9HYPH|nr:hypothetical protein [Sinorhizobium kostiense]MBP2237143.1 hypothetical protein [Sinorhizobium kostiense]